MAGSKNKTKAAPPKRIAVADAQPRAVRVPPTFAAAVGISAALYSVVTVLIAVFISYSSVPYMDGWDYWRTYDDIIKSPRNLFSQHNEHRIAALRLFLLADRHFFAAQGHWLLGCIMATQLMAALIIWRMATRHVPVPRAYSVFLLGCLVSMLFSLQQFDNFTWTFQIGFVLAYAGSLGALASLHASVVSDSRWRASLFFAVALVAAWSATYSLAIGLFVWVLLVSLAFFLRLRGARLVLLIACASLTIAAYFNGYNTPGHHGSPLESLLQPHRLAVYALAYLGLPVDELASYVASRFGGLSESTRIAISAVAGLGIVLTGLRGAAAVLVFRSSLPSQWLVLVHMMVFVIASAGVTALGRMKLSMAGVLTSRYATPAILFWACTLALLAVSTFVKPPDGTVVSRPRPRWALLAISLLLFLPGQIGRIDYARHYRAAFADARNAVSVGVYDAAAWQKLYHSHAYMIRPIAEMRKQHLAAFDGKLPQLIGERAADHFSGYAAAASRPLTPNTWDQGSCLANIDRSQPTQSSLLPGHRFDGWAWDVDGGRGAEVLLIDGNDIIRGFASPHIPRGDVDTAVPGVTNEMVGWVGYATGGYASAISAYAILANGSLCKFGTVSVPDVFPQVPVDQLGPPVPAAASLEGAWHVSGDHYASDGSEETIGVLQLGPFDTASAASLAIPVQTGPVAAGLSVDVFDADTGMRLSALRPAQSLADWSAWRLDLLGISNLKLRIVARDRGTGAGEHLLLRSPHTLR